jgi:hypothetical protein
MTDTGDYLGRWLKMSYPVQDIDPLSLPLQIRVALAKLETGQDDVIEALDDLVSEQHFSDA